MIRRASASLLLLTSAIALAGCAPVARDPDRAAPAAVTIMTFNVQNLFDNVDAPGRDDKAYLPIAAKQNAAHIAACEEIEVASWREECLSLDWNDAVLDAKLRALAETIRQVDGGADIIALQEVENRAILEQLRKEYLAGLGYRPAILVEGQDLRGIDVAFLSKLPLAGEPVLHAMHFDAFPEREADTRGILQASFALPDGAVLTGFAVHFPAPFHPAAMRAAAYERLLSLRRALPDDHHAFAAGDFNTTSAEVAESGILESAVRPWWTIAHETGCRDLQGDCRGTYYYARDDNWSFLDMILYSPARGENATWRIRADSVRVANATPAQRRPDGTPARFRAGDQSGVSDHWPLVLTLEPTGKQ